MMQPEEIKKGEGRGENAPSVTSTSYDLCTDTIYSLWALSIHFLRSQRVIESLRCLETIIQCSRPGPGATMLLSISSAPAIADVQNDHAPGYFGVPLDPLIELKTRLRIADLLLKYTLNLDEAKAHLERSLLLAKELHTSGHFELQIYHHLDKIYQRKANYPHARQQLKKGIEVSLSKGATQWYFYFQMELAKLLQKERQWREALSCLEQGFKKAEQLGNADAQCLFLLAATHVSLILRDYQKAKDTLSELEDLLNANHQASSASTHVTTQATQHPALDLYRYLLRMVHLLKIGDNSAVAGDLHRHFSQASQLYEEAFILSSAESSLHSNRLSLEWLDATSFYSTLRCINALVVRGNKVKVSLESITKGLAYINEQYQRYQGTLSRSRNVYYVHKDQLPLLHSIAKLKFMLLGHSVCLGLTSTMLTAALEALKEMIFLVECFREIFEDREHILYANLGLFAYSVGHPCHAVAHFKRAIAATPPGEDKLVYIIYLFLAYYRKGDMELAAQLLESCRHELNNNARQPLRAASMLLEGLVLKHQSRYSDAKAKLKQVCVKMAKPMANSQFTAQAANILGEMYLAENDVARGSAMLQQALLLSSSSTDLSSMVHSLKIFSNFYYKSKDTQNYEYNKKKLQDYEQQFLQILQEVTRQPEFFSLLTYEIPSRERNAPISSPSRAPTHASSSASSASPSPSPQITFIVPASPARSLAHSGSASSPITESGTLPQRITNKPRVMRQEDDRTSSSRQLEFVPSPFTPSSQQTSQLLQRSSSPSSSAHSMPTSAPSPSPTTPPRQQPPTPATPSPIPSPLYYRFLSSSSAFSSLSPTVPSYTSVVPASSSTPPHSSHAVPSSTSLLSPLPPASSPNFGHPLPALAASPQQYYSPQQAPAPSSPFSLMQSPPRFAYSSPTTAASAAPATPPGEQLPPQYPQHHQQQQQHRP
ncbi:Maternal effect uncoordination 2-2 protein [Balamuthia mandrillaris]